MSDRQMKEYSNYLSEVIKNEQELTNQIYEACQKALKLDDYVFLNEDNRKGVIIPSILDGHYILIADIKGKLHVAYEKTELLKKSQPFKTETRKLLQGENVLHGMHNLFKFASKDEQLETPKESVPMSLDLVMSRIKQQQANESSSRVEGTCLGAMTDIATLKVLGQSFSALNLMNPISNDLLNKIGSEAGKFLNKDTEQLTNDLNFIYDFAKKNKYTVKCPFEYNNGNNKVWATNLPNAVSFVSDKIGYLAKKDGDNWTVYPYSKEYCLNSYVRDITNKVKDNSLNDLKDANLKIVDNKVTYLSGLLYDMAIDLFCAVKEVDTAKKLQAQSNLVFIKIK